MGTQARTRQQGAKEYQSEDSVCRFDWRSAAAQSEPVDGPK